ncbi:hypothetical protein F5I97DRAFT_1832103 [Phlebopus sp. FC_14]|nr:hypothetical protein F5I97DRAFT_1832103 [Phlebopus sp. FC_14]
MPVIRFPRFRHNSRSSSRRDSSSHASAPDPSANDTQAQAQAQAPPPSFNHAPLPHPDTGYGSAFMPPPPPPFIMLSQPPPPSSPPPLPVPMQYLIYVPVMQPRPRRVEFAGSRQGDLFCDSPEPMLDADQEKLRSAPNPDSVLHEQFRGVHTPPPPPPPPPKPNPMRFDKAGGAVPSGRPDGDLAHAGPQQPDRVARFGPRNPPPPADPSTAGPHHARHNIPPPSIAPQGNDPRSHQRQRKHVFSPPRSSVVQFNPDDQDNSTSARPANADNDWSEMYVDAVPVPVHGAPTDSAASAVPYDPIRTSFVGQPGDQRPPYGPSFVPTSGFPAPANQFAAGMRPQSHPTDFRNDTAGPSSVPLNAPRPRYPLNHVLHSALQPESLNSGSNPVPASSLLAVDTTPFQAHTPIEEIYTSGVACVVEDVEDMGFPRDLSPPPRPTLPPWHLAPEGSTLGLHEGEIVETVLTNNMAVAVRSQGTEPGSLSSLGSELSEFPLLRPPAAVSPTMPEAVRRREETREFLRSASATPKRMNPGVVPEEEAEERTPEEPRPDERVSEEHSPEQRGVKPPELETSTLLEREPEAPQAEEEGPEVSVTPSSRSGSRNSTGPVHTGNVEGFHFTVVPPTTVASTDSSLEMRSPPSFQEPVPNGTTVTPEAPRISDTLSPSLGSRSPTKSPLLRKGNPAPRTPRPSPKAPQPAPKAPVSTPFSAAPGPRPTPSPSEQTKVANSSCFLTPDLGKSPSTRTGYMSSTVVSPTDPSRFTQRSFKSQHLTATPSEDFQGFGEGYKAKCKGFPRSAPSPAAFSEDWCGYHSGLAGDVGNTPGWLDTSIDAYPVFGPSLASPNLLFSRENRAPGATKHACLRAADGVNDQSYHMQILARCCIIEVTRMSETFDKCGTLSSGILASAKTIYGHLREALSSMLQSLRQELEPVDENTSAEISWHDRHADTLAAVHRALTRVMLLTEELPRADKIREHLKSAKARADRLNYLTPKLKDSVDRMTMLRLRATLLAKQEQAKNAARTEEARRGMFQSLMDRQKSERDEIRQQMRRLRRARHHSESDDEVSSLASE